MPYTIVKTDENNKQKLVAIPSFWVNKNILKWPRKNEARHVKNKSTPEADWKQLRCVVKRGNIPSYETAEYVIKEMLNHTDTEDDINTSKKPISEKPLRELNLNIIADEILYPAASGSNNNIVEMPAASGSNNIPSEIPTATLESVGIENVYEYHFIQDNQSTTDQHQCCTNLGHTMEIQNVILSNQTQILNELRSIKNVQNTIIQKVVLFSIQLGDAVSQITQAADSNFQVTALNDGRSTPSNTAFYAKPVNNIQQLHELEQQLSESDFRQKMKNTYSVLCNGGKGIDCAYTLADILFSRDFLCQCTWSGGCRGSDTKVAWKSFKHIMSFFWEMVHSWDKTYTIHENESFFKNILKNSKKRKMAKNQRASTSRKRSKLLKVENNDETSDEDTSNETNDDTSNKENPVTDINKDKKANKESDIVEENPITENNPEETDQQAEKVGHTGEENKEHSNRLPNDEQSDMNEENVKTDKNIEYEHKINEYCAIESNKVVDNIEKITIDLKENKVDDAAIKEIEREHYDDKKMTMEVTNSEQNKENNILKEPKNKDKSNEPSTSSNVHFQIEKNNPKKKIVRISKKKREEIRRLKIKTNQPISHKNVSG